MPIDPTDIAGLVAFWDFQEPAGQPRRACGPHPYLLHEMAGPVARADGGVFGPWSADVKYQQWLCAPRSEAPALDIHGPDAQVTVVAWIQRGRKPETECEAVAGVWDETHKHRQYCLFLDLRIHDSAEQVGGHISAAGGPTAGQRWCMDAAIGATPVPSNEGRWRCIAFTYDGRCARAYVDGRFDAREGLNPYPYPGGLHNGGADGADFTVGAVHRGGVVGNWFVGRIGGLAVFDKALDDATLRALAE